jgi:hypothetical protein
LLVVAAAVAVVVVAVVLVHLKYDDNLEEQNKEGLLLQK